jgi:hypothetical protein
MKYAIIALLLLIGCGPGTTSVDTIHVGKDGLVMKFLPNAPPNEVIENTPVPIALELFNKGAADIENSKIVLVTDRNLLSVDQEEFSVQLEGKKKENPLGENVIKTFNGMAHTIRGAEQEDTTVRVIACYPYRTELGAQVCIDPDVTGQKTGKPAGCPPGKKTYSGQGAPVAVVSVETTMIPTSDGAGVVPRFVIEVENVGKGSVYQKEQHEKACSSAGLAREEIGLIDAGGSFLGETPLKCSKTQLRIEHIQRGNEFYDVDRAVMTCEGEDIPSTTQAYIGTLRLTLDYGYKDTISKAIKVKRVERLR